MTRAAALLAVLALAACSGEAPRETNTVEAQPAAPAPPSAPVSDVAAPTGGLRADVSALIGDVSGLNTRVTDMGLVIDLPADALFDFDKATLTPAAEAELLKAAELIRRSPTGTIQVIGHTDAKGDDAYNQRLSEARAQAVSDWLGGQVGVRTRAFQVVGKGETAPIAANARPDGSDDPAGRARNRRVEVVVPREG